MKPLSERDENCASLAILFATYPTFVGMKPLSERDENVSNVCCIHNYYRGM